MSWGSQFWRCRGRVIRHLGWVLLVCLFPGWMRGDLATGESAPVLIADTWISTLELNARGARLAVTVDLRSRAARTLTARVDTILIDPHGHESGHLSQVLDLAPGALVVAREELDVPNARPWSPPNPVRYRAVTRVSVGGRAVDQVTTPFGIRTIRVAPGTGFEFNGARLAVMGASLSPQALFGAVSGPAVERRRVSTLKKAGFNAVRVQGPVPEAFLDACDQLGLLVLMDLLGAVEVGNPAPVAGIQRWRDAMRRGESRVRQDRNRPSVIAWSVARAQREFPDPYREDMVGEWVARIHDVGPDLLVSGTLSAMAPDGRLPPFVVVEVSGDTPLWQQRQATDSGRAVVRFESPGTHPFVAWQRANEPGVAASFTPVEEDFSVTGERYPRSWYREVVWGRGEALRVAVRPSFEQTVAQGEPAWVGASVGAPLTVEVYSRYDTVRLYVNEREVGEAPTTEAQAYRAQFDTPYVPGVLRVVGLRRGAEVETLVLPTPGRPSTFRLHASTPELRADGLDTAFIEAMVTDAAGQPVPADVPVTVRVLHGAVEAVLLGRGATDHTLDATTLPAGRGLILVRATGGAGPARIAVSSPGLPTATVDLNVVPP